MRGSGKIHTGAWPSCHGRVDRSHRFVGKLATCSGHPTAFRMKLHMGFVTSSDSAVAFVAVHMDGHSFAVSELGRDALAAGSEHVIAYHMG